MNTFTCVYKTVYDVSEVYVLSFFLFLRLSYSKLLFKNSGIGRSEIHVHVTQCNPFYIAIIQFQLQNDIFRQKSTKSSNYKLQVCVVHIKAIVTINNHFPRACAEELLQNNFHERWYCESLLG